MDLHREVEGFGRNASAYETGRPGYPTEAVEHLLHALAVEPGATMLDLAAGTGKLTRQLAGRGFHVVAVEPVRQMRQVLSDLLPGIEVLDGSAEAIPLDDGSVDAVTVAQAFHWFRGDEALRELYRVLVPRGALGLVWNVRDLAQPLQAGIEEIVSRYRGVSPSQASGQWRHAFERTSLFSPLAQCDFPMVQRTTTEGAVARVLSTSFMACLPDDEQADVARQVTELAGPGQDDIELSYNTEVYWARAL